MITTALLAGNMKSSGWKWKVILGVLSLLLVPFSVLLAADPAGGPVRVAPPAEALRKAAAPKTGVPGVAESNLSPEQKKSLALFKTMRYGIFPTQTYKLTIAPPGRKYTTMDEFVEMFDVKEYVRQLDAIGFEYVIFTAWHAGIYNLGPNTALEKWLPGHTAKRDLIGELADALDEKGIKLIIYMHPHDGHDLKPAEAARVGFVKYNKEKPEPIPVFNDFINEVCGEMAQRYATKRNVIGLWWDSWQGGVLRDHRIDGMRLRQTMLAHMPQALIFSNFPDPEYRIIDLCSSEVYPKKNPKSEIDSLLIRLNHQSCDIGQWWWCGKLNKPLIFGPEILFQFTVLGACCGAPGGISWALSPSADGKTYAEGHLELLQKLGAYIKPIRESICGVAVSQNWPIKEMYFSRTPGYGATRSLDGSKEYLHVLKVPEGRTLEVKPPKESFVSARLLVSGHPVKMETTAKGLSLTLGDGDQWDSLDTVIVLERAR